MFNVADERVSLLPLTKKGKQLINEHGNEWSLICRSCGGLPCFNGKSGIMIAPLNNPEKFRWIELDGSPHFNLVSTRIVE